MPSPACLPAVLPPSRIPSGALPLAAVMLLCYPLSMILPRCWGWENGPLEVAQVLVLLVGAVLALRAWWRNRPLPLATLALCAAPLWIVLAGRELSWGAVFGAPLALTDHGPVFSSRNLWYKPLVAPAIGLLLGAALVHACRWRLDRLALRLLREGHIPWLVLGLAVLAEAGSSCAEGHLQCTFALRLPYAMVFEELIELAAYLSLLAAQASLFRERAPAPPAMAQQAAGAARPLP